MLAELVTRRPNQYSPVETEEDIQNRQLKLRKAGCDMLLLLLCRHHPEQAILALKGVKTKVKDDAATPLTKIIVNKIMVPPPAGVRRPSTDRRRSGQAAAGAANAPAPPAAHRGWRA